MEQVRAACCNLCADSYLKTDVLNSGLFLYTEIQHQALTWNNVYSGALHLLTLALALLQLSFAALK